MTTPARACTCTVEAPGTRGEYRCLDRACPVHGQPADEQAEVSVELPASTVEPVGVLRLWGDDCPRCRRPLVAAGGPVEVNGVAGCVGRCTDPGPSAEHWAHRTYSHRCACPLGRDHPDGAQADGAPPERHRSGPETGGGRP